MQKVVNGDIIASEKRESVSTSFRQLERCRTPLITLIKKANHIIKFLEMLPDPKTGKQLSLGGFQNSFLVA